LFARDFSVTARITPEAAANGVILAVGSWFGGWSFYLDQGRPVAHHAFSLRPEDRFTIASETALGASPTEVEFRFEYDGGGIGKGGTLTIFSGDLQLAQGRVERTISIPAGLGETMDTGRDTGVPVARSSSGQVPFEGTIREVRISTGRVRVLSF
jgi:arylsulfatase